MREMSLEEFEQLVEVEAAERKQINWDEILREFAGKVFSFRDIQEAVWEKYKKVLYREQLRHIALKYSEGRNGLLMISKKVMLGGRTRRLYYVKAIEG